MLTVLSRVGFYWRHFGHLCADGADVKHLWQSLRTALAIGGKQIHYVINLIRGQQLAVAASVALLATTLATRSGLRRAEILGATWAVA